VTRERPTNPPGERSAAARDPVRDLGREIVARQVRELRRNEPGTIEGKDREFLHDMRVATRRIRAALRLFRDELGNEEAGRLRRELGWLGKLLGSARDLDVLSLRLPAELERVGGDPVSAARILELVGARRARTRAELEAALESERYRALLDELEDFAGAPGGPRMKSRLRGAREVAAKRCTQALRRVLRWRKGDDPALSADALHRLRIDFKQLRYACEFFLDVFRVESRSALRRIVAFQDCLGAHQDAVVAMQLLEQLGTSLDEARGENRAVLLLLGGLLQVARQDAAQERAQFRQMWPKLPKRLRRLRRKLV
jgi:CHAD domain-containing protein